MVMYFYAHTERGHRPRSVFGGRKEFRAGCGILMRFLGGVL
jgi:hypothetical protein